MTNKSVQMDMLGGPEVERKHKPGPADQSHVILKPRPTFAIIPGMASYQGGGPRGKTCHDCQWYGPVTVRTPRPLGTEPVSVDRGCAMYAKRTGKPRRASLSGCLACDCFVEGKPTELGWLIEEDGRGPLAIVKKIKKP